MAKPYDSTTKYLIEQFPRDWLTLAGLDPAGPVDAIDANLSTITAEADKVIRVGGLDPWLAHVEFQSSREPRLSARIHRYNALLDERHDLPTRSIVVLLREAADGPGILGEYRRSLPGGPEYLAFGYDVVRVWREPVGSILAGGLGVLPLAPVADLGTMPLEAVVAELHQRIDPEPAPLRGLLWNSTAIVMGLRHPSFLIERLLRGVHEMEESSYYQAILAKGEAKGEAKGILMGEAKGILMGEVQGEVREARAFLLRFAVRRFGPITPDQQQTINAVADLDQLRRWTDLVFEASSWADFWELTQRPDSTS